MKENKYRAKQKILSFVNAHQTRYPEDEEVQAILKPAVLEYITESLLEISNSVVYSLDTSHILCEDINIPNDELDKSYPLEFDFVIEPEPHYNSQIDMPEGMYRLFITWLNPNVEYHSFFYGLRSLLNNERNFGEVAILRFQDMWQNIKNKNTNNGYAFNNLGAAYMLIGNYDEAQKNFDKAIKEKDFPSKIYFNLAELNLRLGNDSLSYKNEYKALQYYKKALYYLNKYLEIDKTNDYCLSLKRQLQIQLSNIEKTTI